MGEKMTILFGIALGMLVTGLFNLHSYRKGQQEGKELGYKTGYADGFEACYVRAANVVPFPQKEVPK